MTTATTSTIHLPAATIELHPGERYAGPVLDEAGQIKHHLVLLPARPERCLSWQDAMAWAEGIGAQLPDRQEQALLFANCKPHLQPGWHWSCQEDEEDASYAWVCLFISGDQYFSHKSCEGSAVAVRRLIP
ncbi:MAG: DUF1566 domain-containing protein [Burkholderiales bacterium]|nr:DUF1566 domain-containing protein [Burkholderiales bacterium]